MSICRRFFEVGTQDQLTDEAIDEWLEENDFVIGCRYDHNRCPIDNSHPSDREPVLVSENGVHCFSCASQGDGFRSWALLLEPWRMTRSTNRLRALVRNKTHWLHAQHILDEDMPYVPNERMRTAYRALLKIYHLLRIDPENKKQVEETAKLIESVVSTENHPIIRVSESWVLAQDMATPCGSGQLDLLKCLPATTFINEKGERKNNREMVAVFQTTANLATYGYTPIEPLQGVDLRGEASETPDDNDPFASPKSDPNAPAFVVRPASVAPLTDAFRADTCHEHSPESFLEMSFPGVNVPLVKLLIAMVGYAQRQPAEPPMLMLSGQSGAGKNPHVLLAGEICANFNELLHMNSDLVEFKRSIAGTSRRCGLAFVDEVCKAGLQPSELDGCILTLKRGAQYRPMYATIGHFGPLPGIVFADTIVPSVFETSIQLARRIVHVPMGSGLVGSVNWLAKPSAPFGGEILGWRARRTDNLWCAAGIVEQVIKDLMCFSSFIEAAAHLGFSTFEK